MTVRKGYVPRGSSAKTAKSESVPKGTKRRREWGQERLSGKTAKQKMKREGGRNEGQGKGMQL